MPKKSYKSTLCQDKNPETVDVEDEIVELILMNRSLGVSISTRKIIIKAYNLNLELKQKVQEHFKNGNISSWWVIYLPLVQVLM